MFSTNLIPGTSQLYFLFRSLFLVRELILLKTRPITRFIYTVFCETKRQPAKMIGALSL